MKEEIRKLLLDAGACAVGFSKAGEVDSGEWSRFESWLMQGRHAGMEYMRDHAAIRRDPRLLLDGAHTVISIAFNYRGESTPRSPIAAYALGDDYHDVLRNLLRQCLEHFPKEAGYRICIDSAPILERYWARKAGIGIIGDNGALIVPGAGSMVFLAEIITTLELEPDMEWTRGCGSCGACRRSCPTGALSFSGDAIDCNRCLSYLTIEHRGDWTEQVHLDALTAASSKGRTPLFGCDRCLAVCPHNRGKVRAATIPGLSPRKEILAITPEDILSMEQSDFSTTFRRSPIKRGRFDGLRRNALMLIEKSN